MFRSGVVCTVMAIKYMVELPPEAPNLTPEMQDSDDIDNIVLSTKAKKAFNFLGIVISFSILNNLVL